MNHFERSRMFIIAGGLLGTLIWSCATQDVVSYHCSRASSSTTLVDAVCNPSSATATSSPSPSPSPTVLPCSYSETWTINTGSDLSANFNELGNTYTKTVTASTCAGIFVGSSGTFTATSVDRTGLVLTLTLPASTYTIDIADPLLSMTVASQCFTPTLLGTSMTSGNLDIFPLTQIHIDFTFTVTPNGC